jgi:hypothetical protein
MEVEELARRAPRVARFGTSMSTLEALASKSTRETMAVFASSNSEDTPTFAPRYDWRTRLYHPSSFVARSAAARVRA